VAEVQPCETPIGPPVDKMSVKGGDIEMTETDRFGGGLQFEASNLRQKIRTMRNRPGLHHLSLP
jgi:hypothetical protein